MKASTPASAEEGTPEVEPVDAVGPVEPPPAFGGVPRSPLPPPPHAARTKPQQPIAARVLRVIEGSSRVGCARRRGGVQVAGERRREIWERGAVVGGRLSHAICQRRAARG